ncbi:hypothetical protein [Ellagibacter isourolithinifaciens]|uniref:VG15 protein n=1 Tax=Ellagibacter isourolithinifaciens TaxID=2137581 RepID=UPI003A92983C
MISAAEFAAYNREVAGIGDRAASDVESSVLAWCRSHEDATVAEKREAAKLIMEGFVQGYDDVAAEFAAQWYDHRAEQGGARLEQAVTMTTYRPDSVDAVARYQARKLAKGDDAAFAKACGEFARDDAFRSLNETIIANVGRDKDKGVRFARVPTGFETCTFCLMLASRGAVYHTRKTAGEFKHFHRRCDCKVVPSFEDDADAELVEGVRPKELRERYRAIKQIDSMEGLTDSDRQELAERALRVEVESIAGKKLGSVKYVKSRDSLEGHEKAGIDNLLLNGFDIETVKEDPHAPANLDISMNGELWEMKNLTNRASSVSNQVKRARIKWFKLGLSSPSRCVFTNEGNEDGFDETCAALEKRRRPGEVFLAVSNRGVVRVLSDK